ncbi:MAG: FUSC family protein, partial [Candidatus Nanopelagicales bacterium]|nr:FUSC family protein [Candidatus Nanopelagicales bacterium]
ASAGTLAAAVVLPVVLAFWAGGAVAAGGAGLGSVLAFLLALFSGWRRAAFFVAPTLAAAGLSALANGTLWWIVGLAVLGLLTGILAMRGLLIPFAFMGIAWSVSQPTDPAGDLLVLLLFAAIAGTYAILLARRSGVAADTGSVTVTSRNALVGGIGLAIAAGLAGWIAQLWDNDNAYWLPMTVFLLAIPAPGAALSKRAVTRVVGTAVGVGAAGLVSVFIDAAALDYALAFGALVLTLAIPEPRWFNAATTAFAIVLALTPTSGAEVGGSRLGATVTGAVIIVAIAGVLALVTRLLPETAAQRGVVAQFEEARSADDTPPA